ncbi:LacI family DNA-binding transcriptional regulator [Schaalia hyovaginalis]|uniref:LacI family DNA-binding transcriptional regulator n=1 Tax=Schaalia hyovaginalis TaxID=29316 RepID=UPI0012B39DEF|nr:LacI family DNA-binding transcriptional regulator [Schaalia hyovaginalis]MST63237.1 LacI family transcriptional regulator [Schaalia hyovaginalis]
MNEEYRRRKKVTIYDVAREAAVSPSTVSRAFARPGRVNAETAERIREVAEALGYRANRIPRSERDEMTRVLAFVVADVTNPVYPEIMRGFQNKARELDYSTILLDFHEDAQYEQELIQRIIPIVDGVALISSRLSDSAIVQIAKVVPLVAVNRHVKGVASVIPDTERGITHAVTHLAELGHRKLTYLSGPPASWIDGTRWRALSHVCKTRGVSLRRIGPNAPSVRGGLEAAQIWRASPTSALIAFNDIMAIGFIKGVQAMGLEVPADVSVIGVDNSRSSVLNTPSLSSIAPPTGETGRRAAQMLIHDITHRSARGTRAVLVPMGVIFRDSVAAPSGRSCSLQPGIQS